MIGLILVLLLALHLQPALDHRLPAQTPEPLADFRHHDRTRRDRRWHGSARSSGRLRPCICQTT